MKAASFALALALAAVGTQAGCNPLAFNDVADQTWVDSTDKPDDVNAEGYAAATAFAGTGGAGAAFLVVATTPPSVVLLDYSSSGSVEKLSSDVRRGFDSAQNLPDRPALAVIPGGFGSSDSNAFLGVSSGGVHYVLPILTETLDFSTPIQLRDATDQAVALAAGQFIGEDEYDIAALTPDLLFLELDRGSPSAPDQAKCTFDGGQTIAVLGDVLAVAGSGQVVTVDPAAVVADSPCPIGASSQGDGENDLGETMAVGDFDGNGDPDLAVAAPGADRVYVMLNGDFADPIAVDAPGGGGSFGAALAAGDLDHDGDDELAIGAPDFDGDTSGGGQAYVFDLGGDSFTLLATLSDIDPEKNQHFGQSVAVADFDGDHEKGVLAVGAVDEVFTYFQLTSDGVDVRH